MTDEAVEAVRRLLLQGASQREVVRRLGVSKGFVWRVLRGQTPHVTGAGDQARSPRPLVIDPSDAQRLSERVTMLERQLAEVRATVVRLSIEALAPDS